MMIGAKVRGRTILKMILGIFLFIVLLVTIFSIFLLAGKEKTINLKIKGISLQNVKNGTYIGSYSGFRWSNTVEVAVQNHQITEIRIIKPQVFAAKETMQELVKHVLLAQTTDIDVVSGATADSKAFLAAVENALVP